MYYPISLEIENLFSYEKTTLNFEKRKGRITCIYGLNLTDPKVLSNGSGKTSLLDALAIALTGDPLRNISKKEIVRNGYSSGSLVLTLRNDMLRTELVIKEFVEKTKGNKVELWENGVLDTQLKDMSPKDAHKKILELVAISKEDLLNYFLLGKDTYQSFFTTKDSEKKEVINRFSKANIIDPIDQKIVADIASKTTEINEVESAITAANAKLELLEEQIKLIQEDDFEGNKQILIDQCNEKIIKKDDQKTAVEKEIEVLKDGLTKGQLTLSLLKKDNSLHDQLLAINKRVEEKQKVIAEQRIQYQALDQKYEPELLKVTEDQKANEVKKQELREEHTAIYSFISKVEKHLADEIECPSCHHLFSYKDKSFDLKAAKKQLTQKKLELESLNILSAEYEIIDRSLNETRQAILAKKAKEQESIVAKGTSLKDELTELTSEENEIKKKIHELQKTINNAEVSILSTERKIQQNTQLLDSLNQEIPILLNRIDEIEATQPEDKVTPLLNQAEKISDDLLPQIERKDLLLDEKEKLEAWRKRFKKFKSYLANNSISMIENLTNHFLKEMGTHLIVSVDGFREKADGTLKEEITVMVSRDNGLTLEPFQKFSAGERSKIDVAGCLAMQKLINLNSTSGGLDLLWIDEIIDSLDRIALGELIKSLDQVGQTILLISHIDLPTTENALRVEKKIGISKITEQ